jgi:N-acetylmuramoyl-L-alanine amidase
VCHRGIRAAEGGGPYFWKAWQYSKIEVLFDPFSFKKKDRNRIPRIDCPEKGGAGLDWKKATVRVSAHRTIWKWTGLALALAVLIGWLGEWFSSTPRQAVFAPAEREASTLVLDAGHGGEDGGAVSDAGVAESALNLAIVCKLDQLAGLYGVPVRLTRTDDHALGEQEGDTVRERKRADLKKRVELVSQTENALLISIHQNYYQGSSSTGAQVFYGTEGDSRGLADHAQGLLRQTLDPENQRQAAQIPDSVYLMNHISCTAILVECGFLSNAKEAETLQQPNYQTKIAAALLSAYLTYSSAPAPAEEETI